LIFPIYQSKEKSFLLKRKDFRKEKDMNVNRRTIIGILGLIIISIAIFLGAYYNLIQPNHEGMMDMWAILLICIPVGLLIVFIILENIFPTGAPVKGNKITERILDIIAIMLFPIAIIFSIFSFQRYNVKKRLRFLKKYGFAVETNKNVYTYKLENIYILIQQDYTYQISFDYGNTYTNLYDCNIGIEQDKNKVKNDLIEYESSHPVDKQRGDVIDTLVSVINFLKKNIDEILNCKVNR
jgi:hypothetical protein